MGKLTEARAIVYAAIIAGIFALIAASPTLVPFVKSAFEANPESTATADHSTRVAPKQTVSPPAVLALNVTTIAKSGWNNMSPPNHTSQSFVPKVATIEAVEIELIPVNKREEDTLTLKIIDPNGQVINESKMLIAANFYGWVRFEISPAPGLFVDPNAPLRLELSDTGKVSFGWVYSTEKYLEGSSKSQDVESPDRDFSFRIIGS